MSERPPTARTPTERYTTGMDTRRRVLGDAHVDRAEACKSDFDAPFQTLIRAPARTGASREDVMEAFQHVAIYAGVPRANHAIRLAKETYAEMEAEA